VRDDRERAPLRDLRRELGHDGGIYGLAAVGARSLIPSDMARSALVTTLSWLVSIPLVLYGILTSSWMGSGVMLRGIFSRSWDEIEGNQGTVGVERYSSASFYGPATFWIVLATLVSMLPAMWMFRYGRRIGRLWVSAGFVVSGIFAVLFTYSLAEGPAHAPCYVYWIGVAIALQGSLLGMVMRDSPSQTL